MCGEGKEETEFYFDKKLKKYGAYCRNCNRLYQKEYKRIYRERKRLNKTEVQEILEGIDKILEEGYVDFEGTR